MTTEEINIQNSINNYSWYQCVNSQVMPFLTYIDISNSVYAEFKKLNIFK